MSGEALRDWTLMTTSELDAIDRATPVVLPLGSIEAHGHHLPMGTDGFIAGSIAKKACERTGAILMPTLYLAYLGGTRHYTGGVHMEAETGVAIIKNIVRSIFASGFKKIILFNGHGPNSNFIEIATRGLLEELEHDGLKMQSCSWWDGVCRPYHACEVETSVLLACAGEHHLRKTKIIDNKIKYPGWRVHDWHKMNPDTGGVNGTPSRYDLAQGLEWRNSSLQRLVALIENAKTTW